MIRETAVNWAARAVYAARVELPIEILLGRTPSHNNRSTTGLSGGWPAGRTLGARGLLGSGRQRTLGVRGLLGGLLGSGRHQVRSTLGEDSWGQAGRTLGVREDSWEDSWVREDSWEDSWGQAGIRY